VNNLIPPPKGLGFLSNFYQTPC